MANPEHSTRPEFLEWLSTFGSVVQTHASWVVLTTDRAFKFKKPLDLGFLDFSTREKREFCCKREVELNRRLAPNVYQGVLPLYFGPGGYTLDPEDPAALGGAVLVDHAVAMRRLSERDRADVLLQEGRLDRAHLTRLAQILVSFHAALPALSEDAPSQAVDTLSENVRANFAELRACRTAPPDTWVELESAQMAFLQRASALLSMRAEAGHVKDGHGDLRLEHVYFEDTEVVVVDCIEFNDRFRFADTALDLAFLSMDLRRFGRSDLAENFLAEVARLGGDHEAYGVIDFYESYRATVRGKVAALREAQLGAGTEPAQLAHDEASARFEQALVALTARTKPRLIAVCGLIACGKSTLARGLAGVLHCPAIDTDSVRKRLLGVDPWTSLEAAPFTGAYSEETSRRTYERAFSLARTVLESGRTVVVDAGFRSQFWRTRFADLARELGAASYLVECVAPEAVIRQRLAERALGPSVSDARASTLDALLASRERIEVGEMDEHIVCDTAQGGDLALRALLERLGE